MPDLPPRAARKEWILLPEAKVSDPQFLIPDVSYAKLEVAIDLPPRYFLIFQALYETFFDEEWDAAVASSFLVRQRKQISLHIHVSFNFTVCCPLVLFNCSNTWFLPSGLCRLPSEFHQLIAPWGKYQGHKLHWIKSPGSPQRYKA